MPRQLVLLKANNKQRVAYEGQMLQIVSTGATASVGLVVEFGSANNSEDLGQVAAKFRLVSQGDPITALVLLATADTTVDLFISDADISISDASGTNVTATIDPTQLPLAVDLPAASKTGAAYKVDNVNDHAAETANYQPATNIADNGNGTQILAGSANYRRVMLYNAGPDPVAIYRGAAAAGMFAKVGNVLPAGAMFIEEKYAGNGQAFRGIVAAGKAASVQAEYWQ